MIDRIYDGLMGGLERAWIAGWRTELWRAVPQAGRGLEIGVGTGANLPFYPAAATVVATELRPAMLAGALRKGLPPNARAVAADAQALPFRDAAFDWAVA
ncbi:MAG: methyltransferase domain-containing protein, partial [Longimicrobiales bacterium]